jgi:hypothetical protein
LRGELIAIPESSDPGNGIKGFDGVYSSDDLIVITANIVSAQVTRCLSYLVRIGAVANNIAKIYDPIVRWRNVQACLESFEIAVNVASTRMRKRGL